MLLVASAAAAHKLAAPASPTPAAAALRRALLFSGFEPPPRVTRLIEASAAQGALDDLDSASADFEATVRRLRDAAGFSGSPAWHDPSGLPWAGALEAAAPAIRAELLSVQEQQAEDAASWGGADYEAIAAEWRIFHLWKDGAWLPEAVARYPQTVALLRRLEASHGLRLNPLQNVACGFARQPPGSGIAPHCDGNLLGLTCHLGLRVPAGEECWIEVGGERRRWREGQLLLMDTTQTHSTRNGGECDNDTALLSERPPAPSLTFPGSLSCRCDRDILMLNVLRPELDAGELEAFAHYLRAPPLRLLALNPGWLSVPSGALCCAPSGEEEGREEGGAVRLLPAGPWLPQRPQGGTDGVVRFEPLSDRRYRVASGAALVPRELPSEAAAPSRLLPPLPPGAPRANPAECERMPPD